ncbi:hypothetical protein [Nonomuraea sediminis]|nr:hypothetical protein [Nonomuraea sediminis]
MALIPALNGATLSALVAPADSVTANQTLRIVGKYQGVWNSRRPC